jgi:hypothetical protein
MLNKYWCWKSNPIALLQNIVWTGRTRSSIDAFSVDLYIERYTVYTTCTYMMIIVETETCFYFDHGLIPVWVRPKTVWLGITKRISSYSSYKNVACSRHVIAICFINIINEWVCWRLSLRCLMPLSTIFQLQRWMLYRPVGYRRWMIYRLVRSYLSQSF